MLINPNKVQGCTKSSRKCREIFDSGAEEKIYFHLLANYQVNLLLLEKGKEYVTLALIRWMQIQKLQRLAKPKVSKHILIHDGPSTLSPFAFRMNDASQPSNEQEKAQNHMDIWSSNVMNTILGYTTSSAATLSYAPPASALLDLAGTSIGGSYIVV